MPHQIIEYSSNLEDRIDITRLVDILHAAAVGLEVLPLAGVRTRAVRRELYKIADGHVENTFVHVTLRLAAGRSHEAKASVGEQLFTVLKEHVQPSDDSFPAALSLEVQEIDPVTRWKGGNIRAHLKRRTAGARGER
ncbi:MAG: 5-carboxymethyl-2-hydroxymuconate isomerase [Gammaproteobacteria bacterium]|nr:5-carboxymethyl-2-hydroxymuconate isomerase [Gammaproteobacteria bacterium]